MIAGQWRGRRFSFAKNPAIRPTPDRVKETVFNWLQSVVVGARCADLFAGSGALGFEALSRGAASVQFVEYDRATVQTIAGLISDLDIQDVATAQQSDAWCWQAAEPLDLIFADPPFSDERVEGWLQVVAERQMLVGGGYLYLEQPSDRPLPPLPRCFSLWKEKTAGQVSYRVLQFNNHGG
ncbi:MAG: 16S rRNA (guanine966-N2)-methyltransferase [Gammaproteobacteria bacterium]